MKFTTLTTAALMSFLPLAQATTPANGAVNNVNYTVYLVRHAEKQSQHDNPALTECGQQRAQQLASMLAQADIKQIYSTDYQRTQQTAAPLAKKLALDIKSYSPRELTRFAQQLKTQGVNTLVVGHSNTTPQLTSLLTQLPVEPITEKEYQMLYQVTFINDKAKLTLLKQPLTCQ